MTDHYRNMLLVLLLFSASGSVASDLQPAGLNTLGVKVGMAGVRCDVELLRQLSDEAQLKLHLAGVVAGSASYLDVDVMTWYEEDKSKHLFSVYVMLMQPITTERGEITAVTWGTKAAGVVVGDREEMHEALRSKFMQLVDRFINRDVSPTGL